MEKQKKILLLMMLQIVFLSSLIYVNMHYQPKILDNALVISNYTASLQLDEVTMANGILSQKNILGEDPLLISRNFNEMKRNFMLNLAYSFLLIVFFAAMNFSLSSELKNKINFRKLSHLFSKIFIVAFCYLLLIFSFFYSIFNISMSDLASYGTRLASKYVPFLVVSIFLLYFMIISISIAEKTRLKDIAQKALVVGIMKANYILGALSISFVVFLLLFSSVIYFLEKSIVISTISMLLLILSFIFSRLLVIKTIERVSN